MTTSGRPPVAPNRSWNSTIKRSGFKKKDRPILNIDLTSATPEERRFATLMIKGGISEARARKLAKNPELAGMGAVKKAQVRVEEGYYPTWEEVLNLHRCDFWHCQSAQRSQPGWPDYWVGGKGWQAFVEIKARQISGRIGRLSVAQMRFRDAIELAGAEYKTFLFPDEWNDCLEWLHSHTGRTIRSVMLPEIAA